MLFCHLKLNINILVTRMVPNRKIIIIRYLLKSMYSFVITSKITAVDFILISRFGIILEIIWYGFQVNVEKF